jgi:hypothetical protein
MQLERNDPFCCPVVSAGEHRGLTAFALQAIHALATELKA